MTPAERAEWVDEMATALREDARTSRPITSLREIAKVAGCSKSTVARGEVRLIRAEVHLRLRGRGLSLRAIAMMTGVNAATVLRDLRAYRLTEVGA